MGNIITDTIKVFSAPRLKSNIISGGGNYSQTSMSPFTGGGSALSANGKIIGDKTLSTYYAKIKELKGYEVNDLTNTIVGILSDYLLSFLSPETNLISITDPKYKKIQDQLNKDLNDLDIVKEIQINMFNLVYYGSHSFELNWDGENKKFFKNELIHPESVVTVHKNSKPYGYLVVNEDGNILQAPRYRIVRLGNTDLSLDNDMDQDRYKNRDKENVIKEYSLLVSLPIYFNISTKVKEYLLKDAIISLLSIKDLISPLLLLIRVDKGTPIETANSLAQNAENLINKYSDVSSIMSAGFSLADLLDSLVNNIRVLPDYQSSLGDMNTVDLTKISDKIRDIRAEMDSLKEDLLGSTGIPIDLFRGNASKWEALKSAERLNSRITSNIQSLRLSIQQLCVDITYMRTKEVVPTSLFEVNIFKKTTIEYNNYIATSEVISDLITKITEILKTSEEFMKDSKIIDPAKYLEYVKSLIKSIDPELVDLINVDFIKELAKEVNSTSTTSDESGY